MGRSNGADGASASGRGTRRARQQRILDVVEREPIGNQQQLAELLEADGFQATQATVSRDIAELGLVKVVREGRHVYARATLVTPEAAYDNVLLRRVLRDVPIEIRRSGLILLLLSTPGTASIIAEAIDKSTLADQVGTIAGDNTVLVLFGEEAALERWRDAIGVLQGEVVGG
jgi:transcriptional regulator of arginine metabolism